MAIKGKQLEDKSINADKITESGKIDILNTKLIGQSRIIKEVEITTGTNEIDITKEIFLSAYHQIFTYQPDFNKQGVFLTGNNVDINEEYIGNGFENYKVWLRLSGKRLAINNQINNNEVFGELYVKQYKSGEQFIYNTALFRVEQDSNEGLLFNINATHYNESNFLNKIIAMWNGNDDNSDWAIGYITELNDVGLDNTRKKVTLLENSPVAYSGNFKTLQFFLKFKTYDDNGNIIDYTFPYDTNIDIMYIENINNYSEKTTNIYEFMNFYKILDPMEVNNFDVNEYEIMITDNEIIEEDVDTEGRNYVVFKFNDYGGKYKAGSLQVFIDGTRIFRISNNDSVESLRFEEVNADEGKFKIINFESVSFLTQEVFIRFKGV